MDKAFRTGAAVIILFTGLSGCANDLSRAMNYCRDNYSGYTQLECERQLGARYR